MATDARAQASLRDDVGRQLRNVRRRRGLTLAVVAEMAGMSESFLSQLERGRTGASLESLHRLTHALGIRVADLFEPGAAENPRVLRASERPILDVWSLGRKMLLTPRWSEHLEVFICRLDPGGATSGHAYTHGDSDELFLLLDGEVELELGDATHPMSAGDSITYRSSTPHRVVNRSAACAEGIWAISPPSL